MLCALILAFNPFIDLCHVFIHRLLARFDDGFTASFAVCFAHGKLAHREAQKVKPCRFAFVRVERMGDAGFGGFEIQPQLCQPAFDGGLDLEQMFAVGMQDDEIIGIAHHNRRFLLGNDLFDHRFQPM